MLMAPTADANTEPTMALVEVVTAAANIGRGDVIQPFMLKTQTWPRDALPAGVFLEFSALLPEPGQEPRRAARPMVAGELILASKVSNFGEKITIVDSLKPNTRAVAIKVDAVTSVGGFVTPGDSVDILLTRGMNDGLATDTILRNIRIIAVDQRADEMNDSPSLAATVTVEVTAEQGQILALGQRAGTLSLALRDPNADDSAPIERLRLSDLIPEEPVVVVEPTVVEAAPPPPPRRYVVIRRGTDSEEVNLRD
jgi:pilus assembly protein CpaB